MLVSAQIVRNRHRGGAISQKTPVLADSPLFSSQMRGGSQTQIMTAAGGSGDVVEDVLPPAASPSMTSLVVGQL